MIRTCQVNETLFIALSGQLCLSTVYELTDILTRVADSCEEYRLDMHGVSAITDAGLSVLTMFARHARRWGRRIRLIRCSNASLRRLTALPALFPLVSPLAVATEEVPDPMRRDVRRLQESDIDAAPRMGCTDVTIRKFSVNPGEGEISWH